MPMKTESRYISNGSAYFDATCSLTKDKGEPRLVLSFSQFVYKILRDIYKHYLEQAYKICYNIVWFFVT